VGGGYNDRSIVCSSLTCSKFLHKPMVCCVWACMPLCTCAPSTFLRSMLLAPLHPLTSSIHLTHSHTYLRIYTHVSPYLVSPGSNYALPLFLLPLLAIAHAPCAMQCNAIPATAPSVSFHQFHHSTPFSRAAPIPVLSLPSLALSLSSIGSSGFLGSSPSLLSNSIVNQSIHIVRVSLYIHCRVQM
jgi:hypothetical protein